MRRRTRSFIVLEGGFDCRKRNGIGIDFKATVGEVPPLVRKGKKAGLGHRLLEDVLALRDLGVGMFVGCGGFGSEAIEAGGHFHRLAGLGDEGDIDRGAAGMLRGLAEGIGDEADVMAGGIPKHELRAGRTVGIPNLDPVAVELDQLIRLPKASRRFGPKQGRHVGLIECLFRNGGVAGVAEVDGDGGIDFGDPNEPRFRQDGI